MAQLLTLAALSGIFSSNSSIVRTLVGRLLGRLLALSELLSCASFTFGAHTGLLEHLGRLLLACGRRLRRDLEHGGALLALFGHILLRKAL